MLIEGLPPPTVAAPTSQKQRCAEQLVAKATVLWQLLSSGRLTVKAAARRSTTFFMVLSPPPL